MVIRVIAPFLDVMNLQMIDTVTQDTGIIIAGANHRTDCIPIAPAHRYFTA